MKKRGGAFKRKAPFEKGGWEEVKQLLKAMHVTNVQFETPHNCQKNVHNQVLNLPMSNVLALNKH